MHARMHRRACSVRTYEPADLSHLGPRAQAVPYLPHYLANWRKIELSWVRPFPGCIACGGEKSLFDNHAGKCAVRWSYCARMQVLHSLPVEFLYVYVRGGKMNFMHLRKFLCQCCFIHAYTKIHLSWYNFTIACLAMWLLSPYLFEF